MNISSPFEVLSPENVVSSVEDHLGIRLDGMITPYNSYVNRVYGVRDEDGRRFIAKFYRPGRWSRDCILEEHKFIVECEKHEIPVISPLIPAGKASLGNADGILFSVFPLRAGRTFDITDDQDWVRLGSIVGRMHQVGKKEQSLKRPLCSPEKTTAGQVKQLISTGLVSGECLDEFTAVCKTTLDIIIPLFQGIDFRRIHGDCHRGNILDRMEEGLLLIDFDDMMMGPPVQDLWLLLPGHVAECLVELDLLVHGYSRFCDFDDRSLNLIEPLRFMRIIHFLTWCSQQKDDRSFQHHFPGWGTEAFWIKEIEDLKYQKRMIQEHL